MMEGFLIVGFILLVWFVARDFFSLKQPDSNVRKTSTSLREMEEKRDEWIRSYAMLKPCTVEEAKKEFFVNIKKIEVLLVENGSKSDTLALVAFSIFMTTGDFSILGQSDIVATTREKHQFLDENRSMYNLDELMTRYYEKKATRVVMGEGEVVDYSDSPQGIRRYDDEGALSAALQGLAGVHQASIFQRYHELLNNNFDKDTAVRQALKEFCNE